MVRTMNLLIINHYAGGPGLGSEQRPFYLAQEMLKRGMGVTILTADFSHKRRQNPLIETDFEEKELEGVRYIFVKTPSYDNILGGKGQNIAAFVKKSWRHARELSGRCAPDAILCASTYPYDYFVARRIAKYRSAPVIFELREIWPVLQRELFGYGERDMPVRWASHALDRALAGADRVVSVLPQGRRYLEERGVDPGKCSFVPGVVDLHPDRDPLSLRKREFVERIKIGYDFLILYQGYISEEKCLTTLVEAAGLLEEANVGILIAGNGGYKVSLKRIIREMGVHNVYLMDRVETGEKPSLHAMADCLYLGDSRPSANLYGLRSGKLLEYMRAGRPIVAAVRAKDTPVTQAGCGIQAEEITPRALAEAVREMKGLPPARREEMGRRGWEYLKEHHSRSMLGQRYEKLLKDLVDGRGRGGYNKENK